jgi:hypothetical protein
MTLLVNFFFNLIVIINDFLKFYYNVKGIIYFFHIGKMTRKILSVNVYGSRIAIMASKIATGTSMNARKQIDSTTLELSRAMKNVREWKFVEGENKLEYSWFVKHKQDNNGEHLYLYCVEFAHVQGNYQALGLLRDICLVLDTYIVYAHVKQVKTYIKIRYRWKLRNYSKYECFTKSCASMIDDIEKHNVSFFYFYFCILYYF